MRTLILCMVLAVAGALAGGAASRAGLGNSDPAQLCLNGPQRDYYDVVAGEPSGVDFGGLRNGFDDKESAYYVDTTSHGECVSFFAKNKPKPKPRPRPNVSEIVIVKVSDQSSPS